MTGSFPTLGTFSQRVRVALADDGLQQAMKRAKGGFVDHRRDAVEALPEFDQIRDASKDIKDHVLAHLDIYLEMYEKKVLENGGHVHWARTGDEASLLITQLCERVGARRVTKGKSMVSEEMNLNEALEKSGADKNEDDEPGNPKLRTKDD